MRPLGPGRGTGASGSGGGGIGRAGVGREILIGLDSESLPCPPCPENGKKLLTIFCLESALGGEGGQRGVTGEA